MLLQPALGDWTAYKPGIHAVKETGPSVRGSGKLSESEQYGAVVSFLGFVEDYLFSLQKLTDTRFAVREISAEQLTPPLVLKKIDTPVAQFRFDSEQEENVHLYIEPGISNLLIDRAAGSAQSPDSSKELTEIEKKILETCVDNEAYKLLGRSGGAGIRFVASPVPYFDQTVNDSSVMTLFEIEVGFEQNKKGRLFLSVPSRAVSAVLAERASARPFRGLGKLSALNTDKISFQAVSGLGSTFISAKDLYGLEEGDVIALDNSIYNLLNITIGGYLKLSGQPVIKDNKISLQILKGGTSKVEKWREPEISIEEEPVPEMMEEELTGAV